MVDSGVSTQVWVCWETFHWPHLNARVYVCVHTCAPATNTIGCYLCSICSWFTEEECQGLSVPLWYAQIRALGPLFKHLGPGVLERPAYPFATKAKEMEEWARVCARADVNARMIISTTPTLDPNTSNTKHNRSRTRKDRQEFIDLSHSCSPLSPLQKSPAVLWKDRVKALMVISMFNGYMLEKLSFKRALFSLMWCTLQRGSVICMRMDD